MRHGARERRGLRLHQRAVAGAHQREAEQRCLGPVAARQRQLGEQVAVHFAAGVEDQPGVRLQPHVDHLDLFRVEVERGHRDEGQQREPSDERRPADDLPAKRPGFHAPAFNV